MTHTLRTTVCTLTLVVCASAAWGQEISPMHEHLWTLSCTDKPSAGNTPSAATGTTPYYYQLTEILFPCDDTENSGSCSAHAGIHTRPACASVSEARRATVAELLKLYRLLYRKGHYEEAESIVKKVLEIDPSNTAARVGLALVQKRNRLTETAASTCSTHEECAVEHCSTSTAGSRDSVCKPCNKTCKPCGECKGSCATGTGCCVAKDVKYNCPCKEKCTCAQEDSKDCACGEGCKCKMAKKSVCLPPMPPFPAFVVCPECPGLVCPILAPFTMPLRPLHPFLRGDVMGQCGQACGKVGMLVPPCGPEGVPCPHVMMPMPGGVCQLPMPCLGPCPPGCCPMPPCGPRQAVRRAPRPRNAHVSVTAQAESVPQIQVSASGSRVHVSTPCMDIHCDRLETTGPGGKVVAEGNVNVEFRIEGRPATIIAERMVLGLKDGSYEVNPRVSESVRTGTPRPPTSRNTSTPVVVKPVSFWPAPMPTCVPAARKVKAK